MKLQDVIDMIDEDINELEEERDSVDATDYDVIIRVSHKIQALLKLKIKLLGGG